MKVYVVEVYDDLLEDSAIYGRAYLTREAAQRRADRMTGVEGGVKTWARVCELEVAGEPVVGRENAKLREELEFERGENRFAIDFLNTIGPYCGTKDCPSLVEYVEKLRELVLELYHELNAATQYDAGGGRGVVSEFADRMRELGIEVTS